MKKIGHVILIIITSLCFSSCTNDEYPMPYIEKTAFEFSEIQNLKHYDDFIMVNQIQFNNLINFERDKNFSFDLDKFEYLLTTHSLSDEEYVELNIILNHFGFTSFEEFIHYDTVITKFATEVIEKTNFLENDPDHNFKELEEVFKRQYNNPEKSCLGAFSNCVNNSRANYTQQILLCAGGAFGVGAVTGGWGGVLFQLACSGAVYWVFSSSLDICLANYENC